MEEKKLKILNRIHKAIKWDWIQNHFVSQKLAMKN